MISKDLKRLGRAELIEIIYQQKKTEQLLRAQVEELQQQLQDKRLKMETVGSVAEAALAISDIFQSAQIAADHYLEEIRCRHEALDQECEALLQEAREKASKIWQAANADVGCVKNEAE